MTLSPQQVSDHDYNSGSFQEASTSTSTSICASGPSGVSGNRGDFITSTASGSKPSNLKDTTLPTTAGLRAATSTSLSAATATVASSSSSPQQQSQQQRAKSAGKWDMIINLIIRPSRHIYTLAELGPTRFLLHGKLIERVDVQFQNARGLTIQGSWFRPVASTSSLSSSPRGCVVVCHGNAGSRCFALDVVRSLLLPGVALTVFAFDFAGSGLSDGEYVSLGYFEKEDLEAAVRYIQGSGEVARVGVWGRSMGAVTAIMYAADHPNQLHAICADSPYSSLIKVMVDLVKSYKSWIPEAAVRVVNTQIRRSIRKRAHFDTKHLNTVKFASRCEVPAILAHALQDDFVPASHHAAIATAYAGPHQRVLFAGDHGSVRPEAFHRTVRQFFLTTLTPDSPLVASDAQKWKPTHNYPTQQQHASASGDPSKCTIS